MLPPKQVFSWENDVLSFVTAHERELYGGWQHGMPIFEKNWLAMSYQLHAFRQATLVGLCPGVLLHNAKSVCS